MWQTLSRKYATPLLFEPAQSSSLFAWLLLVHLAAFVVLLLTPLPAGLGPAGMLVLLFSLWRSHSQYVSLTHPCSVRTVCWGEGCSCQLRFSSGQAVAARLMPRVFILPWLVILHFRSDRGQNHRLVLLPDMLEPEVFRRLRVRLMIELNQVE